MENLKFSCLVYFAVASLFIADASVVKTNTGINRALVIEPEDSPKTLADIYEELTGDNGHRASQQTQTETSEEIQTVDGNALALFDLKAESPQAYFKFIEEVPLDARDILIWNEDVSESPQNSILLSKEAPVVDNGLFGEDEYYAVLASLQNPLQINDKVSGEDNGLLDLGENLPKSQGAISQEHEQDTLVGSTADPTPPTPTLKCRKTEGDRVVIVSCKGSCFTWQARWGLLKRGCIPTKHPTETVWTPSTATEYCNKDLCN